jgi:hypothetical protein
MSDTTANTRNEDDLDVYDDETSPAPTERAEPIADIVKRDEDFGTGDLGDRRHRDWSESVYDRSGGW